MDLKSGTLFWPDRDGPVTPYPVLRQDVRCDVAVIGAGLTGAMIACAAAEAGLEAVLLDRRDVAQGSTSASTALILYEIDTPLFELIRMIGRKDAERSYHRCRDAIDQIEHRAGLLAERCEFKRKRSLYLASRSADVPHLRQECATRKRAGLRVEYLSRAELDGHFGLSAQGGILSEDAAEIDPFRFTHCLVQDAAQRGTRVFSGAEVSQWDESSRGVTLRLRDAHKVMAKNLVVAAGYESCRYLPKSLVRLKSTYAIATQPVKGLDAANQPLLWETAQPYHYVRTTSDGRMMIGGEDEDFNDPKERDRLILEKTHRLEEAIERFRPGTRAQTQYAWAGTFGETKDGLPYIGSMRGSPRVIYALCYGANGTNFAMIAANIICDRLRQKKNGDARIFSLDR